ncbi:hypothetical protein SAMN05216379_11353 [Nitrosomonas eutropha]|nr:hypothetical protein SAMN05216379_11353 [Nitrosomonas eutropha]
MSGLHEKLPPENRYIYDEFARFRNASFWNRLAGLYRANFIARLLQEISLCGWPRYASVFSRAAVGLRFLLSIMANQLWLSI